MVFEIRSKAYIEFGPLEEPNPNSPQPPPAFYQKLKDEVISAGETNREYEAKLLQKREQAAKAERKKTKEIWKEITHPKRRKNWSITEADSPFGNCFLAQRRGFIAWFKPEYRIVYENGTGPFNPEFRTYVENYMRQYFENPKRFGGVENVQQAFNEAIRMATSRVEILGGNLPAPPDEKLKDSLIELEEERVEKSKKVHDKNENVSPFADEQVKNGTQKIEESKRKFDAISSKEQKLKNLKEAAARSGQKKRVVVEQGGEKKEYSKKKIARKIQQLESEIQRETLDAFGDLVQGRSEVMTGKLLHSSRDVIQKHCHNLQANLGSQIGEEIADLFLHPKKYEGMEEAIAEIFKEFTSNSADQVKNQLVYNAFKCVIEHIVPKIAKFFPNFPTAQVSFHLLESFVNASSTKEWIENVHNTCASAALELSLYAFANVLVPGSPFAAAILGGILVKLIEAGTNAEKKIANESIPEQPVDKPAELPTAATTPSSSPINLKGSVSAGGNLGLETYQLKAENFSSQVPLLGEKRKVKEISPLDKSILKDMKLDQLTLQSDPDSAIEFSHLPQATLKGRIKAAAEELKTGVQKRVREIITASSQRSEKIKDFFNQIEKKIQDAVREHSQKQSEDEAKEKLVSDTSSQALEAVRVTSSFSFSSDPKKSEFRSPLPVENPQSKIPTAQKNNAANAEVTKVVLVPLKETTNSPISTTTPETKPANKPIRNKHRGAKRKVVEQEKGFLNKATELFTAVNKAAVEAITLPEKRIEALNQPQRRENPNRQPVKVRAQSAEPQSIPVPENASLKQSSVVIDENKTQIRMEKSVGQSSSIEPNQSTQTEMGSKSEQLTTLEKVTSAYKAYKENCNAFMEKCGVVTEPVKAPVIEKAQQVKNAADKMIEQTQSKEMSAEFRIKEGGIQLKDAANIKRELQQNSADVVEISVNGETRSYTRDEASRLADRFNQQGNDFLQQGKTSLRQAKFEKVAGNSLKAGAEKFKTEFNNGGVTFLNCAGSATADVVFNHEYYNEHRLEAVGYVAKTAAIGTGIQLSSSVAHTMLKEGVRTVAPEVANKIPGVGMLFTGYQFLGIVKNAWDEESPELLIEEGGYLIIETGAALAGQAAIPVPFLGALVGGLLGKGAVLLIKRYGSDAVVYIKEELSSTEPAKSEQLTLEKVKSAFEQMAGNSLKAGTEKFKTEFNNGGVTFLNCAGIAAADVVLNYGYYNEHRLEAVRNVVNTAIVGTAAQASSSITHAMLKEGVRTFAPQVANKIPDVRMLQTGYQFLDIAKNAWDEGSPQSLVEEGGFLMIETGAALVAERFISTPFLGTFVGRLAGKGAVSLIKRHGKDAIVFVKEQIT